MKVEDIIADRYGEGAGAILLKVEGPCGDTHFAVPAAFRVLDF